MNDVTIWGIHAGRDGEADTLFREQSLIALGWGKLGDLSKLEGNRNAFKTALTGMYPSSKPMRVAVHAGVLYRFVHEVQEGDVVVYPAKRQREVCIGRIVGGYQYSTSVLPAYPHRRPVKWLESFPRTKFSQGALYEMGSAVTLFQVKNYADEIFAALEGTPSPEPPGGDGTIGVVIEEIEETTRDFVLKTLAQELKGHPLEQFIAHLLGAMGYRTRIADEGADGGIDIVAHQDELGFEPPIIKVQVKSTEGSVGDPVVSALYGKVGTQEFGLLVTLGTFTAQAKAFAREKSNLRLIDGQELVDLVLAHYERFDSKYKGILPLKQVYVPQSLKENEEE